MSCAQVVLAPVLIGVLARQHVPKLSPRALGLMERVTPALSGVLVALICGKVGEATAAQPGAVVP
jgi:predicted Na+-dependent transporter